MSHCFLKNKQPKNKIKKEGKLKFEFSGNCKGPTKYTSVPVVEKMCQNSNLPSTSVERGQRNCWSVKCSVGTPNDPDETHFINFLFMSLLWVCVTSESFTCDRIIQRVTNKSVCGDGH